MPLISIIMPAFNAERFLEDSIQTVLNQTFTDWELLIVNDGSTDRTVNIVEAHTKKDERVKLINQENKGVGAARNKAIRASQGEWIAFLDSDDLWNPEKLQKQMDTVNTIFGIDLVFSDGWIFYENNLNELQQYFYYLSNSKDAIIPVANFSGDVMYKMQYRYNYVPILSVLVKKSVLAKVGFQEERKYYQGCEDLDYWIRIAKAGAEFYGMNEKLFYYRKHNNSISGNNIRMQLAQALVLSKNFDKSVFSQNEAEQIFFPLINPLIIDLIQNKQWEKLNCLLQEMEKLKLSEFFKMVKILVKVFGNHALIPVKFTKKLFFNY